MILIQTNSEENSTDDVIDWIHFLAPKVVLQRLNDTQEIESVYYNICNEGERININTSSQNIDTEKFTSYWYRRGQFSLNSILKSSIHSKLGWHTHQYLNTELSSMQTTINISIQDLKNGINNPQDNFTNKIANLRLAKKSGLLIPNTIICDNTSTLFAFIEKHGQVISKSMDSHLFKVEVNESESIYANPNNTLLSKERFNEIQKKLPNGKFLPSLFQEYIDKLFELRVFYLLGDSYAMAIFSQANDKTKVDFRNYDYNRPNRCVPFLLPESICIKIRTFMKMVNLNCGSIDIILTPSKEYVFLEVNPIGQFQWLNNRCNYSIDRKIAEYLILQSQI